ncbi:hypothetical protein SVAN01_09106 [Stagonosporopsis vannaccii]|nr:hypothetical protein SVAN01_09106 [Stagonosporopsis vannaccii]
MRDVEAAETLREKESPRPVSRVGKLDELIHGRKGEGLMVPESAKAIAAEADQKDRRDARASTCQGCLPCSRDPANESAHPHRFPVLLSGRLNVERVSSTPSPLLSTSAHHAKVRSVWAIGWSTISTFWQA